MIFKDISAMFVDKRSNIVGCQKEQKYVIDYISDRCA